MGGCASTSLIKWFSDRCECNCPINSEGLRGKGPGANPKGLKHRQIPPGDDDKYLLRENSFDRKEINEGPITRALFLYDSPYAMVPSLFRRRIAMGHIKAITGKRPNHNNNIADFLDKQEDSFGFYKQFDNWSSGEVKRDYKRLLVHFSAVWEYADYIFEFLGVDESSFSGFMKKRKRVDRFAKLEPSSQKKLMAIYGDLDEKMKNFPRVVVI
jgi:hypothetical protein